MQIKRLLRDTYQILRQFGLRIFGILLLALAANVLFMNFIGLGWLARPLSQFLGSFPASQMADTLISSLFWIPATIWLYHSLWPRITGFSRERLSAQDWIGMGLILLAIQILFSLVGFLLVPTRPANLQALLSIPFLAAVLIILPIAPHLVIDRRGLRAIPQGALVGLRRFFPLLIAMVVYILPLQIAFTSLSAFVLQSPEFLGVSTSNLYIWIILTKSQDVVRDAIFAAIALALHKQTRALPEEGLNDISDVFR